MSDLIGFDFSEIMKEADHRWKEYNKSSIKGQALTNKDGTEYWYAVVAYEKAAERLGSLGEHIRYQSDYMDRLIGRLVEAKLWDPMDQIECLQWSHATDIALKNAYGKD